MLRQIRLGMLVVAAIAFPGPAVHAQVPAAPAPSPPEVAREKREKVPEIFDAMAVRPGAVVADVGAGGGFLTVRLARSVGPRGRVIAVDISAQALERLRARVRQEGLANVEIVQGDENDPRLPLSSVDAAVIVNSYHEMREYHAMLNHLRSALRPGGRLVIVEPLSEKRRARPREEQIRNHEIALHFAAQEVREAGFSIVGARDPFTTRDSDIMWLLVAEPDPLASAHPSVCPLVRAKLPAPAAASAPDEDAAAISSADLRIAFDRFKQLREQDALVVLDVRTEDEFLAGHIPGSVWIPEARVADHAERLRATGKPIVTYCS